MAKMSNELMVEAIDYGLNFEKATEYYYLSCSHLFCNECIFEKLKNCNFVLSKKNLEYLKENYPEYLI